MQNELPSYIVKCFSLAGYDEKEVIKSMETSSKDGNSISTIKKLRNTLIKGIKMTHLRGVYPLKNLAMYV